MRATSALEKTSARHPDAKAANAKFVPRGITFTAEVQTQCSSMKMNVASCDFFLLASAAFNELKKKCELSPLTCQNSIFLFNTLPVIVYGSAHVDFDG